MLRGHAPNGSATTALFHLEGGDIVNLSGHAVAIGLSSRTGEFGHRPSESGVAGATGRSSPMYVIEVPQSGKSPASDAGHLADPLLAREPRVYACGGPGGGRRASSPALLILEAATGGGPVRLIDFGDGGGPMAFEYGNGAAGILPLAPGNLCVCAENLAANEALVDAGMTVHPVSNPGDDGRFGGSQQPVLPLVRGLQRCEYRREHTRLREREGLSHRLRRQARRHQETVGRWESGRTFPRRTHLEDDRRLRRLR